MVGFFSVNNKLTSLNIHDGIAPSGYDSNLLGSYIEEIIKYYRYVELRALACQTLSPPYADALRQRSEYIFSREEGQREETAVDVVLRQATSSSQERLLIEIESLILFASILLDRIAAFTEQFLGRSAEHPWRSFSSFKYLKEYAEKHGYEVPTEPFIQSIEWLMKNLKEFRHLYIAHKHEGDSRPRYGVNVSVNIHTGEASFGIGSVLYPTASDESVCTSLTMKELTDGIHNFMDMWVDYISDNASTKL